MSVLYSPCLSPGFALLKALSLSPHSIVSLFAIVLGSFVL